MKLAALLLIAVIAFCRLPTVEATTGFDLSYFQGAPSVSEFQCLHNSGYRFGIIEASKGSHGAINPYLTSAVKNARQVFGNVDVYIFPDTSMSAKSLMTTLVNDMKSSGVLSKNMIWMDIENTNYWSSSCSSNQSWLSEAISTINGLYKGCGLSTCVGIYSSSSQWSPIMCNTSKFSSYQLWYAHYDGHASFSDFTPFGGWSKPNIKQYAGTTYTCGTAIDKDYYA